MEAGPVTVRSGVSGEGLSPTSSPGAPLEQGGSEGCRDLPEEGMLLQVIVINVLFPIKKQFVPRDA